MQNANELLYQILQVVGRIEANQRGSTKQEGGVTHKAEDGSISTKLGGITKSFSGISSGAKRNFLSFLKDLLDISSKAKDKDAKKLEYIANSLGIIGDSLPSLASGLEEMGKIKMKQVDRAILNLNELYQFMYEAGDIRKRKRVEDAINTFEKMGKSLKDIAKPIKDISLSFAYLGLGILALAGSLVLTGLILGLAKPTDVLLFLGSFVVGILMVFGLLWLTRKVVDKGIGVIKDIGIGMAALSLGIISFAITIAVLPKILGETSILKSLLIMVSIVVAMALMFTILRGLKDVTFKGFMSIVWMSAGLAVLSIAILALATTAKLLMTGLSPISAQKEEKDQNRKFIMNGLGVIGLITLASIALFAILGSPPVAGLIILGAVTMISLSIALISLGKSIKTLVEVSKSIGEEDIGDRLKKLIGGTIEGFVGGLDALSGGKKGISGISEFIKNSTKIFAGTGVLMSMALALSMFAKAITAFAELENMRIIEGYDKDGKPIFGEKVNITNVADNITYSISTFLSALLNSTEKLTYEKATAIKKMGRALTGKRGILSAVIQFADALKVYAQFGEKNEIGYVDYDDKGKEIRQKVSALTVADNMIKSFLYFTNSLFNKSEEEFGDGEEAGISGRQMRRMKRMSKALIGKNGILGAVIQFTDVLKTFAEFGEDNRIPVLDSEGKPVLEGGKPKKLSVEVIAGNIVKALTTFSDKISKDLIGKADPKDAEKAISKYGDLIEQLSKLSSSMDGLSRMSASIKDLASGIGDLAVNIEKLNAEKLSDVLKRISEGSQKISTTYKNYPEYSSSSGFTSESLSKGSTTTTKMNEPKWDIIAAQIGEAVGQKITEAMKKGQIKFEFSGIGSNKGVLELG